MFGYVYRTLNKRTGRVYVGQKTSDKFDPSYHGSGTVIKNDLKHFLPEDFDTKMIDKANTKEELNKKEKWYIAEYKDLYGKKCMNRAKGGEGGDVHKYDTPEEKQAFSKKMSIINKMRCNSDEFKKTMSEHTKQRLADPEERKKHSEKIRQAWSNEDLKAAQSERLKRYYSTHTKDNSYNNMKCAMELNGETKVFESRKDLKAHLKSEYNVEFPNPKLKQLVDSGEPFVPFHKNKENLKRITGMRVYDVRESVETKGDECNPVGQR